MHAGLRSGDVQVAKIQNRCLQTLPAQKRRLSSKPPDETTNDRPDQDAILGFKQEANGTTRKLFRGLEAKVLLKGIWYAESAWGVSLHATDLMLTKDPPIPECPF